MPILRKLKPIFWDYRDVAAGPFKHLFNFRRIWKLAVILTSGVALIPLIFMALIDYNLSQKAIESEILLLTSRHVSNTRRTISFFLKERKSALDFIVQDNSFEELNNPKRLAVILKNLKKGFGGFADIGVIDHLGSQQNYIGPYKLEGRNYIDQEWFREVMDRGVYISKVFLGFRNVPHLVIAIKCELPEGSFYVLRTTLDTERFNDLLSHFEPSGQGDAFIINTDGTLQTQSHYYGKIFGKIPLPIPKYSQKTQVFEEINSNGEPLIVGCAYITDTPFILMNVRQKKEFIKPWSKTRIELIGFLVTSSTIILIVILGVATYLVGKIYMVDQRRVMALHKVEYSNKMASLGRLAAGVAHEINNPLAIINEKAGLIKDIFTFKKEYARDEKLIGLVDSVLSSVNRCGTITKRLLGFARHMDVSIQPINLEEMIHEVLGFLDKEAEYRSIGIFVDVPDDIPQFESDRGKLQQIFLNLVNNAFAAMSDGGRLEIKAKRKNDDAISITVTDNGCGIPEDDIKRVFDPFFTTKSKKGGTGLGLSITYGLVQQIGGKIFVKSKLNKGTSFIITLPLKIKKKRGESDASITS